MDNKKAIDALKDMLYNPGVSKIESVVAQIPDDQISIFMRELRICRSFHIGISDNTNEIMSQTSSNDPSHMSDYLDNQVVATSRHVYSIEIKWNTLIEMVERAIKSKKT